MFRVRLIPVMLGCMAASCSEAQSGSPFINTNIFEPASTPARDVHSLSLFVLLITGGIFLGVSSLLVYALIRFRCRPEDRTEPPQVFGSTQIELAWTIIPVLLITVLFLGTARMIFAIQDAPKPANALDVIVVGHQFWWEYRYPKYGVVTANELHVPQSTKEHPLPTFLKLTSADVMHSYWVPRLAGKTDLLPNRVNELWFDPQVPGVYVGQCAQFCGPEHAKMLLRVYVDPPDKFEAWVKAQQQAQAELPETREQASGAVSTNASVIRVSAQGVNAAQSSNAVNAHAGQTVFEQQACVNCHTVKGTMANGRYGPDLTHLMSRDTIGAGILPNTQENLLRWINDPNDFKPGCLMPAMHLTDEQNAQITAYLLTLH
ncbi:MAG TPA: cytochrome c oxidase subunit II [Acidobacteriaceae bacterium]|nr:cytochrome c oxidase subunit II [Acidobacteriaceae bacterium]